MKVDATRLLHSVVQLVMRAKRAFTLIELVVIAKRVTICALATGLFALGVTVQAGVVLQPGTTIEFASVQQGRAVLGTRDEFIQMMSQFDRCVRMKTSAAVTEAQFLSYIQDQVQAWTSSEQTKLNGIIVSLTASLTNLNLSLPASILLIKTSGNEEGNAAYVRGTSIILPQSMVSASSSTLKDYLTHELFHVYTTHNPQMRAALYGVIGFRACSDVALPQSLLDLKITNPDAFRHDFFIRAKLGGEHVLLLPVLYSKSATYTGGSLFDYLVARLLELEETPDGLRAKLTETGEPILIRYPGITEYTGLTDFYEQIGWNSGFNIHPEETLADNFMQVVLGKRNVSAPRIHHLLRRVLQSGSPAPLPFLAGRFTANLIVPSGQACVLEASTQLPGWQAWDCVTNGGGHLEVCDPTAWLRATRFYCARTGKLPALQAGDTNNMVWISPGTFLMGSPTTEEGRTTYEGPQHLVTLSRGFWLGKFEVTQAEYQEVMGTNPSGFAGVWSRPVENVSWDDAVAYCVQLTQREQAAGRLPSGFAYRLPTEAEWEYTARAGTTSRYSFGDDPDYLKCYEHLWVFDTANTRPHPVGLLPANAWGLHDMHGNVSEWCQDWRGDYSADAVTDPQGPATGTSRVVRGEGWRGRPSSCRSAQRGASLPATRYLDLGFRVALAPTGP